MTMYGSRGNGGGSVKGRGARGQSSPHNHTPKCINCGERRTKLVSVNRFNMPGVAKCPKCFRCGLSGPLYKGWDYGRKPVASNCGNSSNSANVSSVSSASEWGACG